jgi:magnesium chelatase subunit I
LAITEQEANITKEQTEKMSMSDLIKRLVEQVAFEARNNEYVIKRVVLVQGLQLRHLKCSESAERRAIIHHQIIRRYG